MELEFTVTEDHILSGKPRQAHNCAVAECLKEKYSMASVSGCAITLEYDDKEYKWDKKYLQYKKPDLDKEWAAFQEFVGKFDDIVADEYGDPCTAKKRELFEKWEGHLTFKLGEHHEERPV